MMKFLVKSTTSSRARIGVITAPDKLPNYQQETPHVLLYTKGGTVPHLTNEVLQMITKDNHILMLPLDSAISTENQIKQCPSGITEFIGMKQHLSFISIQDAVPNPEIKSIHEKGKISLWSRFGRVLYNLEKHKTFIDISKPDMFLALCDGDTNSESSNKRITKSIRTSKELLEEGVKLYNGSSHIIGGLVGGYDVRAREEYSRFVGNYSLFGVFIDGLFNNDSIVDQIKFDDIKAVVEASLKHISVDTLRILHGGWSPITVLHLVELGVDLFDTSYPYLVTERGSALIFSYKPVQNGSPEEPDVKKVKEEFSERSVFELNLNDSVFADKFVPISNTCSCLTCKNHSRAYIHHLLNVKELLGPVLLMIHNLHHYLEFFKFIRKAVKENELHKLKELICKSSEPLDD